MVGAADVLTIQQETLDYIGEMAPGAGITFSKLKDQWPLDQTEFSGVASKIVAACDQAKADALCLMVTAPQADAFMKALKGAGLKIPVIGGPTLASAIPLFAQGTKNVDGMYFISTAVTAGPQLPDSYPQAHGRRLLRGRHGGDQGPAGHLRRLGADAVNLMAEAVTKAGGTDKAAVRDAFESIQGFQGFSGVYNYSATDHVGIHGRDAAVPDQERRVQALGDSRSTEPLCSSGSGRASAPSRSPSSGGVSSPRPLPPRQRVHWSYRGPATLPFAAVLQGL